MISQAPERRLRRSSPEPSDLLGGKRLMQRAGTGGKAADDGTLLNALTKMVWGL